MRVFPRVAWEGIFFPPHRLKKVCAMLLFALCRAQTNNGPLFQNLPCGVLEVTLGTHRICILATVTGLESNLSYSGVLSCCYYYYYYSYLPSFFS